MNNIIYNDNIITPENNTYNYYRKFTKKLNKRDCVKLALFCTKTVNPNTKENNDCIELIEKWLKDKNSVRRQELYYVASAVSTDAVVASTTTYAVAAYSHANTTALAANTVAWTATITNDINLYLKTLLRTIKQYNTKIHNNQHYESILKEIIKEDIDKLTDTDYNMLIDISQEYYNINPNIINKRIFVELLRREYE